MPGGENRPELRASGLRRLGQAVTGSPFWQIIAHGSTFKVKPNYKGASLSGNDRLERTRTASDATERSGLQKEDRQKHLAPAARETA